MPGQTDLNSILEALQSPDEEAREAAATDLRVLMQVRAAVPVAQGAKALRLAAQPYPFKKPDFDFLSRCLVELVSWNPQPYYIPLVIELFDKLNDQGKWYALTILAELKDRDAALAYMTVIRRHAEAGRLPRLAVEPLEREPRHADVFFPELFHYAKVRSLSFDVHLLCLDYCQAGLLSPEAVAPFTGQVLDAYRSLAEKLRPAQRPVGVTWMWEEPYTEWRVEAGLLLDLLVYFPASSVEPELRRALEYRDPRLMRFALTSLLRLGTAVDVKHVVDVAAHAEMRNSLYETLRTCKQLELYPEKYRTQAAFAESDIVHWLTSPTELGRVPDDIELMKVVPIDTGREGGIYDYYVFRFRMHEPHALAKDGWLAGISGPFLRKDHPTTISLGETFSEFTPWESKLPEEHVGDVNELTERWRNHHIGTTLTRMGVR